MHQNQWRQRDPLKHHKMAARIWRRLKQTCSYTMVTEPAPWMKRGLSSVKMCCSSASAVRTTLLRNCTACTVPPSKNCMQHPITTQHQHLADKQALIITSNIALSP